MGVIDDILAKEPEQRTVEFCLDRDLREALSEAQLQLEQARKRAGQIRATDKDETKRSRAEIADLEEREADLVAKVKARLVRFTFTAIEHEDFDRLKGDHRPTEAQKTKARKESKDVPEWDEDRFPPALIAAACVKVETPSGSAEGLSFEDAERLWQSRAYNETERAQLFYTAYGAMLSQTRIDIPKDGLPTTAGSATSSTSATE